MSKKPKIEKAVEPPSATLSRLSWNFDVAQTAMIVETKPSQAVRDAVQAHGLALFSFMKEQRALILDALLVREALVAPFGGDA